MSSRQSGSRRFRSLPALALMGFLTAAGAHAQDHAADSNTIIDPRLTGSRAISARFAEELRAALMTAMSQGGAIKAIGVCKEEAPAIAARLSSQYEASVRRTGLRVRNSANAPQPWQVTALQDFEQQFASGAQPDSVEFFQPRADGSARYLKAIPMQPLCLACHGENITPDIKTAISTHYPDDRATGFRAGELRGAFSIEWPATEEHSPGSRESSATRTISRQ